MAKRLFNGKRHVLPPHELDEAIREGLERAVAELEALRARATARRDSMDA